MGREAILVIKLGALGDFVQALGPMAAIRKHHPDAAITLLTTAPFRNLAQASGYFNDIIIDERPKFFEIGKWLALRNRLNAEKFGRVYDLQNNDRTQFYMRLFYTPKPVWVGAGKGATIRNDSPDRTAGSGFDGHVQTLGLAGIKDVDIDRLEWIEGRTDFEGLTLPYVLLVAGSAPTRPEKRWPAKGYIALAQKLAERGVQPVLIGTEAENDVNGKIAAACTGALNLSGQTNLSDVVALARKAQGAIGNDTGPMHMIAPTGIPTMVLFSRHSNPQRHAPKGHNVVTIQKGNLEDLAPETVWKSFSAQASLPS